MVKKCLKSLSPRNSIAGDIVMRPFVCGWVSECICACLRASVALCLVGSIQATVFAQILSNFTCKFLMMRGVTLFLGDDGVKGQNQILHFDHKTFWARCRLQFGPDHFKTSNVTC